MFGWSLKLRTSYRVERGDSMNLLEIDMVQGRRYADNFGRISIVSNDGSDLYTIEDIDYPGQVVKITDKFSIRFIRHLQFIKGPEMPILSEDEVAQRFIMVTNTPHDPDSWRMHRCVGMDHGFYMVQREDIQGNTAVWHYAYAKKADIPPPKTFSGEKVALMDVVDVDYKEGDGLFVAVGMVTDLNNGALTLDCSNRFDSCVITIPFENIEKIDYAILEEEYEQA